MNFSFLVRRYDFQALRNHAMYVADKLGIHGVYLSFDNPSSEIRKLFPENTKSPSITLLPDEVGQKEMNAWGGLWVSATSDKKWSFVATEQSVLGKPYWLIAVEFVPAGFKLGFIKQLFLGLVKMIRPDLAMGYDEYGAPYNVRYFSSELGPWAGLRDIYWLNYWGEEYSDLIGVDRIRKSLGICFVENLDKGIIFVVDKSYLDSREKVINSIGSEFFIRERLDGGAKQSSGLLELFKTLYQLSKDSDAENKVAVIRPDVKCWKV